MSHLNSCRKKLNCEACLKNCRYKNCTDDLNEFFDLKELVGSTHDKKIQNKTSSTSSNFDGGNQYLMKCILNKLNLAFDVLFHFIKQINPKVDVSTLSKGIKRGNLNKAMH